MDQIKIGNFIKDKRKEKGITQSELAELMGVSDRAISKWETGRCLPDAGKMPLLCDLLGITLNDLFSGEVINMNENEKKLEENLMDAVRDKQKADKELLKIEIVVGILASVLLLACIFTASFVPMPTYARILLIVIGLVPFLIGIFYCIRIEQVAGYYECQNCHKKYVPTYKNVLFSQHLNRSRKMKCPYCNEKTWHKKVIGK